eukprot:scaffold649077_cov46-Prasinocladus_malaysianus.AAC.1
MATVTLGGTVLAARGTRLRGVVSFHVARRIIWHDSRAPSTARIASVCCSATQDVKTDQPK